MKVRHAINLHKALVIPVVLAMMLIYHNFTMGPVIYLSLHGTYSLLWLIKDRLYPDRRFSQELPVLIGLFFVFVPLMSYWVASFILISRHLNVPLWLVGVAVSTYIVGVFLHYVSDAQKYFTLQLRKGLITDGLFGLTRNPNYLGEIMIYLAFAMLAQHWLPFLILGMWTFGFFLRNMWVKDRSLSRYPEFPAYKMKSGLLIPKLFRNERVSVKGATE